MADAVLLGQGWPFCKGVFGGGDNFGCAGGFDLGCLGKFEQVLGVWAAAFAHDHGALLALGACGEGEVVGG